MGVRAARGGTRRLATGAALGGLLVAAATSAQERPPIGVIDFYGLRTLTKAQVRAALGFAEGDAPASLDLGPDAAARIASALGVARVELRAVCCNAEGASLLYVGVDETGGSEPSFLPPPEGDAAVPAEVLAAYEELGPRVREAVLAGQAGEDDSAGHALSESPRLRELQESFVDLAVRHRAALTRALRESPDRLQRAAAATVLAYLPDKAAVVPELERATRDPDDLVRNDATRALGILARYGRAHPELEIHVDAAPLLDQLGSVVWSDRNKVSMLLFSLSPLDPELRAELERRSLPELVEMCDWTEDGHAFAACVVLSDVLGLPFEGAQSKPALLSEARRRLAAAGRR